MSSIDGLPPSLSNLIVEYGAGGIDIADVEATDKVYIYATSTHSAAGITLVAVTVGPGTLAIGVLDLTAFLTPLVEVFQSPISVWAVWTTDDVHFSAPSDSIQTGLTILAGITFSDVSIDMGGALHVTIAGLPDPNGNDVVFIQAIQDVGGGVYTNLLAGIFKGNGVKVAVPDGVIIFPLDPSASHEFNVLYWLADGQYSELFTPAFRYYIPPVSGPPFMRPRQAPGLEERNP